MSIFTKNKNNYYTGHRSVTNNIRGGLRLACVFILIIVVSIIGVLL